MGLRRRAREYALQFLFQYDITREPQAESTRPVSPPGPIPMPSDQPGCPSSMSDLPEDVRPFVEQLVSGVMAQLPELDATLQRATEHWSVERMAVVDRNVLRCALYELLFLEQIPAKVTMNEAIEIAKAYGSDESGAFVNGILDRIMKVDERLQHKRLATAASE